MAWPGPSFRAQLPRVLRRYGSAALIASVFTIGWAAASVARDIDRESAPRAGGDAVAARQDSSVGGPTPDSSVGGPTPDSSVGGPTPAFAPATGPAEPTYVAMRNVLFHVHPEVALRIRTLHGTMRSLTTQPIHFDDPASFRIRIHDAEVGVAPADLTALLNTYVFAYPGAPLRDLAIRIEGNELVQTGTLRKGVNLPFEIHSTVSLTPGGEIRLHATRTRLLGVGVSRVMRALGLRLDRIVDLRGARGARVEGNDIILDVERALPPPSIEGRLVAVRVEDGVMVQRFGPPPGAGDLPERPVPDPAAPNYMFYRGGVLRFGKLVMLDADMQIVDLDPRDPFRFDIRRYLTQLVPGYSKTLPDGGLEVFMRDIDDAARSGNDSGRVRHPAPPPLDARGRRGVGSVPPGGVRHKGDLTGESPALTPSPCVELDLMRASRAAAE